MWGNTIIIDQLIAPVSSDALRAKEEDKLVLAWEQRRWARGRFTTVNGRKIGIALPTGSALVPDSILWIDEHWYLKIEAAPESVLEISPIDCKHAVMLAFEVGNRHIPMAMRENKLMVPDDKAMVRLMDRLGAKWERKQTTFDPIGNTQLHQHG
jgi:urease accessory protein